MSKSSSSKKENARQSVVIGLAAFASAALWAWFTYEGLKDRHAAGIALETALHPFQDPSGASPELNLMFLAMICGGFYASAVALCLRIVGGVGWDGKLRLLLCLPVAFAFFVGTDRVVALVSPSFLPWMGDRTPEIAWRWVITLTLLTSMLPLADLIGRSRLFRRRIGWLVLTTLAFCVMRCLAAGLDSRNGIEWGRVLPQIAALWLPFVPFLLAWSSFQPRGRR